MAADAHRLPLLDERPPGPLADPPGGVGGELNPRASHRSANDALMSPPGSVRGGELAADKRHQPQMGRANSALLVPDRSNDL